MLNYVVCIGRELAQPPNWQKLAEIGKLALICWFSMVASLAPRTHGGRRADVGAREETLLLQSQFPRELRYDVRRRPEGDGWKGESSDGEEGKAEEVEEEEEDEMLKGE